MIEWLSMAMIGLILPGLAVIYLHRRGLARRALWPRLEGVEWDDYAEHVLDLKLRSSKVIYAPLLLAVIVVSAFVMVGPGPFGLALLITLGAYPVAGLIGTARLWLHARKARGSSPRHSLEVGR